MYVCPSDFTTSLVLIRLWTLIYKSMVSGVSSLDEIYRLVSFWVNEKIAQSYVSNEIYSGNSLFHQQVPSKSCSCGNLTHPFCYFYDYYILFWHAFYLFIYFSFQTESYGNFEHTVSHYLYWKFPFNLL